jgi:isoleucyl-tRNA synthetase
MEEETKIENYNFETVERSILTFWKNNQIYEKVKDKGKNGPKYYFLQGPPYTSGKLHTGHAWNNSLKDLNMRYRRMKGYNVWDRAGYDMHGLPTAHQVQKLHSLTTKEDIEKFGIQKFSEECMKYCLDRAKEMDVDLFSMGVWMDYKDPYYPVNGDFIEGEWWLIKRADEEKRLYKGKRTMSWCPSCGTALAKHEQEYKILTDNSIFVKFPVKNKAGEFLIIWTTTPWTLAFNLAVMVNPDKLYSKINVNGEVWIVASELANSVAHLVTKEDAKVLEEFKGEKLEGLEYDHPWKDEIHFESIKEEALKTHTVLLSKEYVETSSGSGLVHCAPGCGPEDYEVGYRNGLPTFNEIDHSGKFKDTMGKFSGRFAKKDDLKFVQDLEDSGHLIKSTKINHDYAHCDRCKSPVVFRATEQWFFKVEDLIPRIKKIIPEIKWVPESAGKNFELWFDNLRDNSITRQRFWGTPVPIWVCDTCDKYVVIGSRAELREKGCEVPENLHRPWIDQIIFKCECGGVHRRIPDVLDVWIDSGTVSWNCLYFPQRKDLVDKFWPIDFILEANEQVEKWFYQLLTASMITMGKPCFDNVYLTGMLNGVDGVKMSKSLGNIISPYEIIDKYGADTMRAYLCSIVAGKNINFSWNELDARYKNLFVLWNLHKFLIEASELNNLNPRTLGTLEEENLDIEEQFIFSKTYSTLKKVTELLDIYNLDSVPELVENLYLTISRTYVQLVRDKVSSGGQDTSVVIYTLYKTFIEMLKMYSLVCPFITEMIYQNLKDAFDLKQESIHLLDWSEVDETKINLKIERNMDVVGEIIQGILSAREKVQISRRWPLGEVIVETQDEYISRAIGSLGDIVKNQTNVKEINVVEKFPSVELEIKPNFVTLKETFAGDVNKIIPLIKSKSHEELVDMFAQVEKGDNVVVEVDDNTYLLEEKHFLVERKVPHPYKESVIKNGMVYINQERNQELELEGYVREVMRRIQALRKKANLAKLDRINLNLKVPQDLLLGFQKFDREIEDKTGASKLILISAGVLANVSFKDEFEIKKNKFELGFNVVQS